MPVPYSVNRLVPCKPVTDLVREILKHYIPDIPVRSALRPEDNEVPMILVNKTLFPNPGQGELRYLRGGSLGIDSFASGVDADYEAELISDAVLAALVKAKLENFYRPDVGRINGLVHVDGPIPGSDWAPALGPVQFADSPYHLGRSRIMVQVTQRVYP